MTDNEPQDGNNPEGKPVGLTRPGRLELKKTVESGEVRQSFSHGRTKTVQVEKKKKRTFKRTETGNMAEVSEIRIESSVEPEGLPVAPESGLVVARQLTEEERAARARAVEGALKAENEARALVDIETPLIEEPLAATSSETEPEAGIINEAPVTDHVTASPAEPAVAVEMQSPLPSSSGPTKTTPRKRDDEANVQESERAGRAKRKSDGRRLSIGRRGTHERRRAGKMTVVQALSEEVRQRSLASVRRAREREKRAAHGEGEPKEIKKIVREVVSPEAVTVQELANRMAVRGG
ncbi:MAG: translation initiation factor IF-2 associated domain-containing protein, partial [Alphaproteobacteria bacterium]